MSGTIYGTPKITTTLTSFDIATANKPEYALRVSDSGTEINGLANISGALTVGSPNMTGPLQARYIRFQRVTNLTSRLNLTEIEVYDLNGIQLNKSTWTVNASSQLSSNFAAANLIDGNLSTFYHSQFDANSEWIEVDMGELKTFSSFILFNRIDSMGPIIGITVILKDNAGVEIDTPFLVEDNGVYGIVSGSTRRVITSGIATYTFRSFYLLNVNGSAILSGALSAGSANISDSLTVNSNASISGALTAGSANITGSLQARYIRFQRVTNVVSINLSEIQVIGVDGIELDKSTWVVDVSQVFSSFVGANLIDGNLNTYVDNNGGANAFIEVDMGELKTFSHFILFNRAINQSVADRSIGLTVILKDNAGVEIDTPFLVEDIGAYGIVSGSTRRVITSGNATYTFRNTALNVYGPVILSGALSAGSAILSDSLTVNSNANISGALTAGSANISNALTAGSANITGPIQGTTATFTGVTIQSAESTLNLFSTDNTKNTILNVCGGGGASQGTGILYVGQNLTDGGGIEYNGDSNPVTSGAGSDFLNLFRRTSGSNLWTARNPYNTNNWEFRGDLNSVSANISNALTAGSANLSGALTAGSANISGALTAGTLNASKIANPFDPSRLSTDFISNTSALTANTYYRIASANSGEAFSASFSVVAEDFGIHQTLNFHCSYNYGSDFSFTLINNSVFGTNIGIKNIRLRRDSSNIYADNYLEFEIGFPMGGGKCKIYMSNNFKSGGLTLLNFTTPVISAENITYTTVINNNMFSIVRDSVSRFEVTDSSVNIGGSANISGQLTAQSAYIGNLNNNGNVAQFSHANFKNNTNNYALVQDNAGGTYINSATNQPIRFSNNDQDRMILASNGNFGIGTTNPTAKLDVSGSANFSTSVTTPFIQGVAISNPHKIRLWSENNRYTIGMITDGGNKMGGLLYNATTFTMNDDNQSGWIFKDTTHTIAEGAMGLTTNGRMTLATSLRLGYGESDVTTPSVSLDVNGTANISGALSGTTANFSTSVTTPVIQGVVDGNGNGDYNKIRLWDSPDNYTIGFRNPNTFGSLNGFAITFTVDSTAGRGFLWRDSAHGTNSGAMSLTNQGILTVAKLLRVGYGPNDTVISSQTGLDVIGVIKFDSLKPASGSLQLVVTSSGIIGTITSDIRLKENIEPINESETHLKLLELEPKTYQWKDRERNGDCREIGLIAQEVKEVLPELVFENNNGMHGVHYDKISILMLQSIKQLQKQIDELKNENIQMRNEIIQLKK
jgi:hypothetical protein